MPSFWIYKIWRYRAALDDQLASIYTLGPLADMWQADYVWTFLSAAVWKTLAGCGDTLILGYGAVSPNGKQSHKTPAQFPSAE